jgi:hypothetical protein
MEELMSGRHGTSPSSSGGIVEDILPITGTEARMAVRLCNFQTAQSFVNGSHVAWLDLHLKPLVQALEGPWVDLIGYASRLGDFNFNAGLSNRRCDAVRRWISNYSDRLHFNRQHPKGESESTGGEMNNDGYWRAVEVLVYGHKPPKANPTTIVGSTEFEIRVWGGASVAPTLPNPYIPPPQGDAYVFQIVDTKEKQTAFFVYGGAALSLPTPPSPFPNASLTSPGPPVKFGTTQAVTLRDFEGKASLFQDPSLGKSLPGQPSLGGKIHLSMDSDKLLLLGARITPTRIIGMEGGKYSMQPPSLGSVPLNGRLTMLGTTRPFTGY